MAPKLYSILGSPPVRAVLMCAKALGVELDIVTVNLLEMEHLKEDFLKKNPQHTVPVLEDDDGFVLSDSHAIMGYLVAKYGKNDALYPKDDYKQRATIDHRMFFDAGILFAHAIRLSKPLIFYDTQPTKETLGNYKEALQILDRMLKENKTDYVAGNSLSIADFSITATVTSYDIFVSYSDFPHVKAYIEKMKTLPWYEANKEGLAMLNDIVGQRLKK